MSNIPEIFYNVNNFLKQNGGNINSRFTALFQSTQVCVINFVGIISQSLRVRDFVRDSLEKDPIERTNEDIDALLELTQQLKAFTNMTLTVRRELCAVMVFAVVEKGGTIVMNDGEELDSWSVLVNGTVEVTIPGEEPQILTVGDSFGILPTMDKLYHKGYMRTKCDDCQFVCITQNDYYRIQHQGEENTRRHEVDGKLIMVTELRGTNDLQQSNNRRGHVVIRATAKV